MREESIKVALAALCAASAAYLKVLALPVAVLFVAMIIDYITGIAHAYISGTLCSKSGFLGILKKLCYMFAVVCGVIIDYVCSSAMTRVGIGGADVTFFGTLVAVWLILNEVVSILENLSLIGVPLPSFLGKIAEKLKSNVESDADNVD